MSEEVLNGLRFAEKRGYYRMGDDTEEWRKTFVGRFFTKWPKCGKTIDVFKSLLGHVPTWADITDANLRDLRDLLSEGRCSSSVKTMCNQLKAVINANMYDVRKDKDPLEVCDISKSLSVKRNPSEAVYLTREELERFHRVKPYSDTQQYVKRIFMIEALTGARHVDAERICLHHLDVKKGTLTYRAEKTGNPVTVPIHKWLMQYLVNQDQGVKPKTLNTFNDTLRQLCFRANIRDIITLTRRGEEQQGPKWRFVSSHTGRRTFATLLFLHGAGIPDIARLMGHSDPQITWRNYICAEKEIDERTLSFFK